nr:beta-1,4-glucuronyltransferase 1-like [Leptinotarsa decemlineata]
MNNSKINRTSFLLTFIFTCIILSVLFLSGSSFNSKTQLITVELQSSEEPTTRVPSIPGAFLRNARPDPSNSSYCNFHYKFPKDLDFVTSDLDFGPELGKDSPYRILYNVIGAKMAPDTPAVTYATHVTADFMNYLPELARHWDGYISVAAFVPDLDIAMVLEQLNQYCFCLPEMTRVSVHLVFHKKLPPSRKDVYFIKPSTCEPQDSSKLQTYRHADDSIMYPINVCRNAARTAALTENVLVSDIQLMPSAGLAKKYIDMIDIYKLTECPHRVFVLPIFEVESTEEIPRTKKKLLQLVREEKAVYFHKLICSHCQKFPGIESWLVSDPGDFVKPLTTARREVPYHRWEPIYIGTKSEPFYNEMLSWEGLQDKMLQMLEMCLIGYKFVILDGAFLIHWPGMKKTKTKDGEAWRDNFIKENSKEYQKILKNLTKKYNPKPQCKAH